MKKIINNKNPTVRIEYLDMIRGFGIILMIMGHIGFGESFNLYIHAFHMPMFYIISGYLFKTDTVSTEDFVVRKARQLLLPYFFFSAISFFEVYVLYGAKAIDIWSKLKDTFFNPTIGEVPISGALWFLVSLFWINIIFHFLYKWLGKNDYVLFVASLMIGFVAMLATQRYNIFLPMGLDAALVGVAFEGTGYFLKQMSERRIGTLCFRMNVGVFIVMVIVHGFLVFSNGAVNFRVGQYQNIFLTYFCATAGTILLWNLCKWLSGAVNTQKKAGIILIIEQIGAHSITFVCLNQLIIQVVSQRLAVPIFENSSIPFLKEIVILLVVVFILYVTMEILENSKLRIMLGKNN